MHEEKNAISSLSYRNVREENVHAILEHSALVDLTEQIAGPHIWSDSKIAFSCKGTSFHSVTMQTSAWSDGSIFPKKNTRTSRTWKGRKAAEIQICI